MYQFSVVHHIILSNLHQIILIYLLIAQKHTQVALLKQYGLLMQFIKTDLYQSYQATITLVITRLTDLIKLH